MKTSKIGYVEVEVIEQGGPESVISVHRIPKVSVYRHKAHGVCWCDPAVVYANNQWYALHKTPERTDGNL